MTNRKMKAFVVYGKRQGRVEEVDYPQVGSKDVVIKVHNVGICGTDYHIFEGEFLSPYPIIPGHEFSGVIEELGVDVTGLEIGDRVCVDPTLYCGACEYCLTNRFNHCNNWGAIGNTTAGAMAEYVSVPAKNVVKMPDTMSFEQGAFVEPIACVVHGMNRLQVQVGNTVLLYGAGAMGLQLVQALAHAGASQLIVVDVDRSKLDLAMSLGGTRGVLASEADVVLKHDYPHGFDIVVDATGISKVIQGEFQHMGKASKYLQFGVTPTDATVQLSPFEIYNNDWTILGSMAINNTFLAAFKWIVEGRIDIGPILTHKISLADVPDLLAQPKENSMLKAQIQLV